MHTFFEKAYQIWVCNLFCRVCGVLLCSTLAGGSLHAAGAVNPDYIRSLAAPGKIVVVIEYYDGNRKVVDRKGFTSASGFEATSAAGFKVDERVSLRLYGVEACQGEMVNRREGFAGTCEDYGRQQLSIKLNAAKVIFCRAFLTEAKASRQDVTCFGYYHYPGTLDSVDNLEEQLVSIGAFRLARKSDGAPLRPDLVEAEKIGRSGFGMWVDPRVQEQNR